MCLTYTVFIFNTYSDSSLTWAHFGTARKSHIQSVSTHTDLHYAHSVRNINAVEQISVDSKVSRALRMAVLRFPTLTVMTLLPPSAY